MARRELVAALTAFALGTAAAAPLDAPPVLSPDTRLGVLPPAAAVDPDHVYDLVELVDFAESANAATRIAWDQARGAAAAAGVARRAYLPQLAAVFMGMASDTRSDVPLLGQTVGGRLSGDGVAAALTLQWLLFDDGGRSAAADAAQAVATAAGVGVTAAHQSLVHGVCVAYYAFDAARARVANAALAVDDARDIAAASHARYTGGVGTAVDAALADAALAQARFAEVQADRGARNAYLRLLTSMGVSPLTRMRIATSAPGAAAGGPLRPVDDLVRLALSRRTDVRVADEARQAGSARVRAARAEFAPKVFAAAQIADAQGSSAYTLLPPQGPTPPALSVLGRGWGGSVVLGVELPLYDAGMRAAAEDRARVDADAADAAFDQVRDEAARQVVGADDDLRTAAAALDAARADRDASRTAWTAAFDAWDHGVESLSTAEAARSRMLAAANAASDAWFAERTAAVDLAMALGGLGAPPAH